MSATSNFQLYTKAAVYVNGQQLCEEASVKINRVTNAQEVKTVCKGFAGMSEGSRMCSITIDSAVPTAGFEMDPGSFMQNLDIVELTIFAANQQITSKGYFTSDDFSHSVDSSSKLEFQFVGSYPLWQTI